jgi:hypothetical protein
MGSGATFFVLCFRHGGRREPDGFFMFGIRGQIYFSTSESVRLDGATPKIQTEMFFTRPGVGKTPCPYCTAA